MNMRLYESLKSYFLYWNNSWIDLYIKCDHKILQGFVCKNWQADSEICIEMKIIWNSPTTLKKGTKVRRIYITQF